MSKALSTFILLTLTFTLFFSSVSNSEINIETFSSPALIPKNIELSDITLFAWGHHNLEPMDYRDRPPFLAPKGTSNIALGKPVTSSTTPLHGELKQITDGDKHYERTSLVELPGGLQWIQVDLEQEYRIYAIVFWHFHKGHRVYFDVIVRVSCNDDFKEEFTTVYNNDDANTSRLGTGKDKLYLDDYRGRLVNTKSIVGRYIRFYSNGNFYDDLNHYVEVEIYGLPKNTDDSNKANEKQNENKKGNKDSDNQELVPIEIELPEPYFGGPPID